MLMECCRRKDASAGVRNLVRCTSHKLLRCLLACGASLLHISDFVLPASTGAFAAFIVTLSISNLLC